MSALLLLGLLWNAAAGAQDLALTTDSEQGFLRFMHMARTGKLGEDVREANVGIFKNWVRIELVCSPGPNKVLVLTPKSSAQVISRYFDIEPREGATARDVMRVGKGLDEVFETDPFQLPTIESRGGDRIPSLAEAWEYGGWRGVMRVLEHRMVMLASRRYTVAVIVALTAALLASLVVLWGSTPPR